MASVFPFYFVCLGSIAYGQDVTPEIVERGIKSAIEFLRREQNENGSWSGYQNYDSAQTSLCLVALLNCGLTLDDPAVSRGLKYVANIAPAKTYETALQTMAYCAANPQKYSALIRRNIEWLEQAQVQRGDSAGGWDYDGSRNRADTSNSQFAVLALWEAQRALQPVSSKTMDAAKDYWMRCQAIPNRPQGRPLGTFGGWTYPGVSFHEGMSGSMTCAGIASMVMTEDALEAADAKVVGDKIRCCGFDNQPTPTEIGLSWLDRNATIVNNPNGEHLFYYLYALERVGRLTGQRFFNKHDWYREGCRVMLERQLPANGYFSNGGENDRITDTSLALLFLSKGKRQIVISRLSLDTALGRDRYHRHSLQHLTGHIEQAWKRDLAWQTISIGEATVKDLLESPILFLTGSERLQFTEPQKQVLKEYLEQGGFLFAEAADANGCDGKAFDESFRALMEELFERPLNKLPISHPIWFAEGTVDIEKLPSDFWLYGLEACCRTSVVYSPISLSCRWELLRPYGVPAKLHGSIRDECQQATLIGINIATYATGRELKQKLEKVEVISEQTKSFEYPRGVIQLPRLAHSGGAEDTPKAIPHLMDLFAKELPSRISNESPLVSPGSAELEQNGIVYLSGRRAFEFNSSERESLRKYFKNGGLILGDSVCGSMEFTKAVREVLSQTVPEAIWKSVAPDHPMLTDEYQGYDIRRVTIIRPSTESGQAIQVQRYEGTPVIELLIWENRPIAIFSPYDLSCALESRQSSQCLGYPRADAAKIAINMILYAMLHDREQTEEKK